MPGLRDVANLAWKLKLVCDGLASPTLLAGYQREREPQVRSIIAAAVAAGHYICERDAERASVRDHEIRTREQAGGRRTAADLIVPISGLIAQSSRGAGARFIQPSINGRLLDDITGGGFRLLHRAGVQVKSCARFAAIGGRMHLVGGAEFLAWLDHHEADLVLIRPDHYVFGTARVDDSEELLNILLTALTA